MCVVFLSHFDYITKFISTDIRKTIFQTEKKKNTNRRNKEITKLSRNVIAFWCLFGSKPQLHTTIIHHKFSIWAIFSHSFVLWRQYIQAVTAWNSGIQRVERPQWERERERAFGADYYFMYMFIFRLVVFTCKRYTWMTHYRNYFSYFSACRYVFSLFLFVQYLKLVLSVVHHLCVIHHRKYVILNWFFEINICIMIVMSENKSKLQPYYLIRVNLISLEIHVTNDIVYWWIWTIQNEIPTTSDDDLNWWHFSFPRFHCCLSQRSNKKKTLIQTVADCFDVNASSMFHQVSYANIAKWSISRSFFFCRVIVVLCCLRANYIHTSRKY